MMTSLLKNIFKLCLAIIVFGGDVIANDLRVTDIPIQEGGRIKPLDTYARNQALAFYGKRKIKHENRRITNHGRKLIDQVTNSYVHQI